MRSFKKNKTRKEEVRQTSALFLPISTFPYEAKRFIFYSRVFKSNNEQLKTVPYYKYYTQKIQWLL